jgi:hypothetical protein
MSEVSSWSPTDASNNLTPPDGWPEGMQPSGVNDCGRMMMGAIRRWYNTVSAGIANCLPLSGGTLTGNLFAPYIQSNGNMGAIGDISGRNLAATVNVNAGANVVAGGTVYTVDVNCSRNIFAAGEIRADGGLFGATATVSGTVYTTDVNAVGNAAITGNISAGSVSVAGPLTATYVHSSNNIDADGAVFAEIVGANAFQLAGQDFAFRGVDAAGPVHIIYDPYSAPAIDMYGTNGTYYRCDNAHFFTNRAATLNICRFQSSDGNCINASGYWNIVSDISTKEAVEPYRAGLAELLALNPVSYRYTPGKNPFAIDGQRYYGLVAQEVEPILPEMVGRTEDGLATVAPGHLVLVLISAIKELEARLAEVESRGG